MSKCNQFQDYKKIERIIKEKRIHIINMKLFLYIPFQLKEAHNFDHFMHHLKNENCNMAAIIDIYI